MSKKRLKVALIGGALLGLVCVVGLSSLRQDSLSNICFRSLVQPGHYRFGRRSSLGYKQQKQEFASRCALGLLVSFPSTAPPGFTDHISFIAGVVYGVILRSLAKRSRKNTVKADWIFPMHGRKIMKDVIRWLLEGDVSVQYLTHKHLLNSDQTILDNLQNRIEEEGFGAKIFIPSSPMGIGICIITNASGPVLITHS